MRVSDRHGSEAQPAWTDPEVLADGVARRAAHRDVLAPEAGASHGHAYARDLASAQHELGAGDPPLGLDRDLPLARVAEVAQKAREHAEPVPTPLRLGPVGVPDAHREVGAPRASESKDSVRADAGVAVAERTNPSSRQLEAEPCRLDDHVVVAERLVLGELPPLEHLIPSRRASRARLPTLCHAYSALRPPELSFGVGRRSGARR